jgi:hypothetical protein
MANLTGRMTCADCGLEMNHHAEKLVHPTSSAEEALMDPALGGVIEETHTCPGCGMAAARRVSA